MGRHWEIDSSDECVKDIGIIPWDHRFQKTWMDNKINQKINFRASMLSGCKDEKLAQEKVLLMQRAQQ